MNIMELTDDILSTFESKCLLLRQRPSAALEEECEVEYVHPYDNGSLYAVLPYYCSAIAVLFYDKDDNVIAEREDQKERRTMRCRTLTMKQQHLWPEAHRIVHFDISSGV